MKPIFDTLPEQRIAYLVLRKCGCTSILGAFEKIRTARADLPGINELHGDKDTFVRSSCLECGKGWYTFTMVRDPIRRFLSFYSNKILNRSLSGNQSIENPQIYGYRTNMSFDQAIDVAVGRKYAPESHVIPVSETIDKVGFELNFIGKMEDFTTVIDRVAADTGVKLPIFHLNKLDRIPLLLNKSQFDRLSEFYHEDQTRFGYTNDYDKWCDRHVADQGIDFQTEEGFEFENEAKLLKHEIKRMEDRFQLELTWRVDPNHSRERFIRVLNRIGNDQEILARLPGNEDLNRECDDHQIATELVEIPFSALGQNLESNNLCVDIYFWNGQNKKARLLNFTGGTRLVLPLV